VDDGIRRVPKRKRSLNGPEHAEMRNAMYQRTTAIMLAQTKKLLLLKKIDEALDTKDKKSFMILSEELIQVDRWLELHHAE
jgi:uncharacterized protein YpiB (UPF0302 family)